MTAIAVVSVQSLLYMPVLENIHKMEEYEGCKDFIAENEVEIMQYNDYYYYHFLQTD